MGRKRKTDKEIIKEIEVSKIEVLKEITPEVITDELEIVESDNEEQKRLKQVFIGFRKANPELWNRDKHIYLEQIKKS